MCAIPHKSKTESTPAKSPTGLRGKRVAVTRPRAQAAELVHLLTEAGAEIVELPMIEIHLEEQPDHWEEISAEIGAYEWIVFTSANGVRGFFNLFMRRFEDIRCLGMMRVAAVGPTTVAAVRHHHIKVDLQPETATAEALAAALATEQTLDNLRILVVTGNRHNDQLVQRLEAERAIVDTLAVYRTDQTDLTDHPGVADFRSRGADAIVFFSGSAVQSFVAQMAALRLERGATHPVACSIGPSTSEALRKAGLTHTVQASEASVEAAVEALEKHFRQS